MAEFKTFQGILALIDIVNFTPQATKLGDVYSRNYTDYFSERVTEATQKFGFRVIKTLGDAALLFGTDVDGLLEIMLDLFQRDKLEDRFGFHSSFRMTAHSGFFQFEMDGAGNPVDLRSAAGIKVFRLEKFAEAWELGVTQELYAGIKGLLTEKGIEASKLVLDEPLKGFVEEDWKPPFYKLTIKDLDFPASNLLEPMSAKLEREVQFIPVFGNIYPQVPMEDNFINLSLICDDFDCLPGGFSAGGDSLAKSVSKRAWHFGDVMDRYGEELEDVRRAWANREGFLQFDVPFFYKNFMKGVILGLPGAGKTTILRHLAFQEFRLNLDAPRRRVVLFTACRHAMAYDVWFRQMYGADPKGKPDVWAALEFFTWGFVSEGLEPVGMTPESLVEAREAMNRVKAAFKENRVTLLIDALDEAGDESIRNWVTRLFIAVYNQLGGNRLYLTSRPAEGIHFFEDFRKEKVLEFRVLNLNQDQVRAVARHLLEEESPIYKKFDEAIWREEVVAKMAATPITALLVTAYFQAYEKFDLRFAMYDLLVKFILLKVWENIKTGRFPFRNLALFFKEVKKPDFLDRHEDTRILYHALARLCFDLFYGDVDGKVQRSVDEDVLMLYFVDFIKEHRGYHDELSAKTEAELWKERFHRDHLLLQSGVRKYVFVHSTVMEFLAAYYLVQKGQRDSDVLKEMITVCLEQATFAELETLPIAAGHSVLFGYHMLSVMRRMAEGGRKDLLFLMMAVRCVAELESLLKKSFAAVRMKRLLTPLKGMVFDNRPNVAWIYEFLQGLVLEKDKQKLRESISLFEPQMRLSRETFLTDFLDSNAFNQDDGETVSLRCRLLKQLVQDEPLEQWLQVGSGVLVANVFEIDYDNILQLDTTDYHPEDKNFKYYYGVVGNELLGFYGSPNLKHSDSVTACAVSPDGRLIVSASEDYTLKLWDRENCKEIRTFYGHTAPVTCCAFSPDGAVFISGSYDKTLKLWDTVGGKEICAFNGHTGSVYTCAFSPDGSVFISGSLDKTLKLWDAVGGKEIRTFNGHTGPVYTCAFSPDGSVFISGSYDKTLKLWETAGGKEIRAFKGHTNSVTSCAFSPDGAVFISGSGDNTLKLWDRVNGKEIRAFNGHKDIVTCCAFSPDGAVFISGSWDKTLKLWDRAVGKEIRVFNRHTSNVACCAFSPDGAVFVSGSDDNTLKLWDTMGGKEILAFNGHKDIVACCAFSPDGAVFISGSGDNTLKLWDTVGGNEIRAFNGHAGSIYTCAFSPDGAVFISGSYDDTLKLWDMVGGKEIRAFNGHTGSIYTCAFSPDGAVFISGSEDKTLKLWNTVGGKEIRTFSGHTDHVTSCAFSPDGTVFISGSYDKTLKLWDRVNGKEIRAFNGHKDIVTCCAFSPDGAVFISGSGDKTIKLWDTAGGKEIRAFKGHTNSVTSCAFSPDGAVFISGSLDKTLKLWDTNSGKLLKSLDLPWIPRQAVFHPNIKGRVLCANWNGTLTLFDFSEWIP